MQPLEIHYGGASEVVHHQQSPTRNRTPREQQQQTVRHVGRQQQGGGGTATVKEEVFNLVKNNVGVGVLGLPAGIAAFGNAPGALVPASLLVLAIGMLSGYGFLLIGRVCAYTNTTSYRDAWTKAVSPKTAWMPAAACVMVTTCTTVACSMVLADTIPQLFVAFLGLRVSRTHALLAVTFLVLLPLCLLKQLSRLAPFSLVGIMAKVFTIMSMAIRYWDGSYQLPDGQYWQEIDHKPVFGNDASVFTPNVILLISMLSAAFNAHYHAPKFYHDLRENTMPRFYTVVWTSYAISIVMFVAVAGFGFLTFGEASASVTLHNYATQDGLMSLSRIAVSLSTIFSYPLVFAGVRNGILDLAKMRHSDAIAHDALTLALLGVVTFLAIMVNDLRVVFALSGATCGNAVIYLFPTYMFCSLAKKQKPTLKREVPLATAAGLVGLAMGVIGTMRAIMMIQQS